MVAHGVDDLQAFHGLQRPLMVNDEEMFALLRALRGTRRDAARPRRERRRRRWPCRSTISPRASPGRRAMPLSRPLEVEGEAANRAIMLADQAGVPLYIVHPSCVQAHEAIARARAREWASTASR